MNRRGKVYRGTLEAMCPLPPALVSLLATGWAPWSVPIASTSSALYSRRLHAHSVQINILVHENLHYQTPFILAAPNSSVQWLTNFSRVPT